RDGVWTRLNPGDTDPDAGRTYTGPTPDAVLRPGERVIVDEAGMLDQDTAHALLTITAEAGAAGALAADGAQLPAVSRAGGRATGNARGTRVRAKVPHHPPHEKC